MATKGVLIVDDNPLVRSSLRHLFECHSKFEVSGEAEDGQDAIGKAEGLRPDLIVMDLSMPNMNGLEAAPLLRAKLPNVRLVLFTAHDGHPLERLAKEAGIHAVVSKGENVSQLITQALALLG